MGFGGRRARTSELHRLADEDLIRLVHDGRTGAFEVLFDRHCDAAFSLAYRMCGRRTMAEDVVQEAFLSLWRSGVQYDPGRGSVRAWLLRVVHNRTIDAFRHSTARFGRDVHDDAAAEHLPARELTDVEVERREDVRQVRDALDGLPNEQRQVIELAYFGGFSHSQIAEMLHLPAGTVKGRMRLGLAKLKISLGQRALA